MIYKILTGNELYVYMNGELLLKRWLNQDCSAVFCTAWGGWVMQFKDH